MKIFKHDKNNFTLHQGSINHFLRYLEQIIRFPKIKIIKQIYSVVYYEAKTFIKYWSSRPRNNTLFEKRRQNSVQITQNCRKFQIYFAATTQCFSTYLCSHISLFYRISSDYTAAKGDLYNSIWLYCCKRRLVQFYLTIPLQKETCTILSDYTAAKGDF